MTDKEALKPGTMGTSLCADQAAQWLEEQHEAHTDYGEVTRFYVCARTIRDLLDRAEAAEQREAAAMARAEKAGRYRTSFAVEAMRWHTDADNSDLYLWAGATKPCGLPPGWWQKQKVIPGTDPVQTIWFLVISNGDGYIEAADGDWITKDSKGRFDACAPSEFAAHYEALDD